MFIVKNRKYFYIVSAVLIALSLGALGVWGLEFGIDFKGGSLIEVEFSGDRPTVEAVSAELAEDGFSGFSARPTGDRGYLIRTPFLSPEEYQALQASLGGLGEYEEKRFDSIGPTIGSELRTKSLYAIILVLLAITLFITLVFRKVSEPVSSWKYGVIALLALGHDVLIPTGLFAVLGVFAGAEVDTLFVTALLVILGFSVHDTIVVFDRVRENLRRNKEYNTQESFEETVGRSVMQTLNRSINTSLTTIFALVALYFLGPDATKFFSLALLAGIVAGTYSSIFFASPLLVTVEKLQKKK